MRRLYGIASAVICALAVTTSSVLACGAPTTPPPPPPAPPIVCCVVIKWFVDPDDPNFECLIVRYFRQDGQPLYQSNPMPLPPTQACLCGVPGLPLSAMAAGVRITDLTFGGKPVCDDLPANQPGYGPFMRTDDPAIVGQMGKFFAVYAGAAGDVQPPDSGLAEAWLFGGPGTIPPGQFFDIFQKVRIPRGYDPRQLCIPGQMWALGLFLVDNGQVLAEPPAAGLPPIPFNQFVQNPGASAFYKFKWYPLIVPNPCPPCVVSCVGDLNGDNVVNFADLNILLAQFNAPCP